MGSSICHRKSGVSDKGPREEPVPKQTQLNNFVVENEQRREDDRESLISQSFSVLSNNNKTVLSNITPQNTCEQEKASRANKKLFDYKYIIGKGGFGKVWKVEHKKNRNQFAMKEMLKSL